MPQDQLALKDLKGFKEFKEILALPDQLDLLDRRVLLVALPH